ncbi:MAG TPA: sigma-70 family RNA polymerase sigma factor [Streptosporangiaceae bacterium]|jgi:RNA polymerase sigma factor (sigma-70 family)
MRDRDIAASLAAGEPDGLAAAYDHHAAGLYGYCRSLLGQPADAADAVQDTFIVATAKVAGLHSPARLRSWMYAIARNECRSRLRAGAWPARAETGDELAAPVAADSEDELRYLVLDALSRLGPDEREVAELSRRHGLDHADLAGVLGVPERQARALAAAACDELDGSLGTLLVAGTGGGTCPGLDALLDGWDGRPTVMWRTRAGRHIDGCEVCGERRRRVLGPAMLLRLVPLALVPESLREQVLWLVPDGSPEAVSYRDEVIGRSGPLDPAGFPVQIAPAGWTGRSGRAGRRAGPDGPDPGRPGGAGRPALRRRALAAALLILVAGGGVAALVLHGSAAGRTAADPAGARAPFSVPAGPGDSAAPGAPGPGPARPISGPPGGVTPGSSAPPARPSAPARSQPAASPGPGRSAPPRTPPPKPRPAPPRPVLSASPGTVQMFLSGFGFFTGSFTLSAVNGPVSFSVSAPAGMSVSEASGTVSPGSPVTISLRYPELRGNSYPSGLTVNGITVGLNFGS